MPRWAKMILALLAIGAVGAALCFAFVMYVVLFGGWRWGPN
jgi:hypothetical protein